MHLIDWLIVILPALAVIYIGYRTHAYTKGVAGFLSGGRVAGRYVVAVSSGEAGLGLISVVAIFELYYKSGFAIGFWGALGVPISLLMTLTGFIIYRYRETRVMTIAQFFEVRYSKRFRIFTGILAFISGVINYAIFPAVGARFIIYYTGLPTELTAAGWSVPTIAPMMLLFLGVALTIALIGGQLTIMVTDCVQGIFSYIGYAIVLAAVLTVFSFKEFGEVMLSRGPGVSFVNPFDTADLKDFNLLFIFIGLIASVYNRMAWQGAQGFNSAAINAHEQKMAGVLGVWKAGLSSMMIMLLALAAYTYMHHPDFATQAAKVQSDLVERIHTDSEVTTNALRTQMLVPIAVRSFLPIGVTGVFFAIMVFLMVSTDTSYMHSWGSIFIQDILLPLRKKPFSEKQHLLLLRLSITGVAVFAFFFSLLYGQTTYILMFFAMTGALYLGGAGAVIIGGLYWSRGTTAGAWAAMIIGTAFALTGFFCTQFWADLIYPFLTLNHPGTLEMLSRGLEGFGKMLPIASWTVGPKQFPISGQEILLLTIIAAVSSYVGVSLLTCKEKFNLDRMLHRGKYERKDEALLSLPVAVEKKRGLLQKLLGFNEKYSRGDRILAWAVFCWSMGHFLVFAVSAIWNLVFGVWSSHTWFLYWKYYTIGLTLVVATVTAIWFTIGGTLDLRKLFLRLKTLQVNAADDGRVIGHMNADDFDALKAKEASENNPMQ